MDTAVGLCDAAREHLKAARWAEGEAAARRAIEVDARSDDGYALLGVALCRLGRSADGIDALGQAVHLNPANITARFNLASARQQAGHLEAARAELQAVLGLDPNNTKARGALAVVDWQIGQAAPGAPTADGPPGSPFAFDLPGVQAAAPPRPAQTAPPAPYPPAQPGGAPFPPQQPATGYAPQPQAAAPYPQQPAVRYDLAGNPIAVPPPQPAQAPPPQPGYQPPQPGYQPPQQWGAAPQYGASQPRYGAGRGASGGHASAAASTGDDTGGWSLDNITAILFSPSEFFESQRGFFGLGAPVLFNVINQAALGAVVLIATLVRMMTAATSSGSSAGLAIGAGLVGGLIGLVTGVVFGVAVQFAVAGLVHLFAMLFGGRQPFGATYRALVYASVPTTLAYCIVMLIVMVAPSAAIVAGVLVLVAAVWGLVLGVMALSQLQDISSLMAFLALFLTGVVILIVAILLGSVLGVLLSRLGGAVTTGPFGGNNPFGGTQPYQSPFGSGSGGFRSGPPGFGGPSGFPGPGGMRGRMDMPGFPGR